MKKFLNGLALASFLLCGASASHAETKPAPPAKRATDPARDVLHGYPADPTQAWLLAAGGRIYDNWWDALGRRKPDGMHPAYPKEGKRKGPTTWRCVECHGWDYNGKDGLYGKGERFTGIKGIRGAKGRSPAAIMRLLRAQPHGYTEAMIKDDELRRVALWVSRGQYNADRYISRKTDVVRGNRQRGAALLQTICATCHGFDGRLLNWGTRDKPAYIGTEARKLPDEVLHKIRHAHPGAAMVSLQALRLKDAIDLLAYAQTLPAQ